MCINTAKSKKDTEKNWRTLWNSQVNITNFNGTAQELRSLALLCKGFAAETPCRWDKASLLKEFAEAAEAAEAPELRRQTFILANRWHGTKSVTEHLRTFLLGDFRFGCWDPGRTIDWTL